jgi:hypothetical protein
MNDHEDANLSSQRPAGPSVDLRCPKCRYDLTGLLDLAHLTDRAVCPECAHISTTLFMRRRAARRPSLLSLRYLWPSMLMMIIIVVWSQSPPSLRTGFAFYDTVMVMLMCIPLASIILMAVRLADTAPSYERPGTFRYFAVLGVLNLCATIVMGVIIVIMLIVIR